MIKLHWSTYKLNILRHIDSGITNYDRRFISMKPNSTNFSFLMSNHEALSSDLVFNFMKKNLSLEIKERTARFLTQFKRNPTEYIENHTT